ncbi:hypothetical protein LHA31_10185 [Carnobacterium viridans]|uniref:Uncharacterized protein n=1 Tax=Carnobacterium viridans TaxID=174587 RepID=A0A1H0YWY4_9LACT|nr:hypothetical protein [Carnobacterium viridans]UDE94913.1 hypothetical protein LHA31_10185 [Carnobacterium viridans]SDQ19431.1 hypothetical protein SAMN04487752_1189 [Carnobacterium viridans]
MFNEVTERLISASTLYFWGTDEIDEESKFWYKLFFKAIFFSAIILILGWIF